MITQGSVGTLDGKKVFMRLFWKSQQVGYETQKKCLGNNTFILEFII